MGKRYVAVDIGAGSGRVISAAFDGARLSLDERHRFDTTPRQTASGLWVDMLAMHREIISGLTACAGERPRSVAIDTWGVTPALLDHAFRLASLPIHYRDRRTTGVAQEVYTDIPRAQLYAETGIQELPFNTGFMLRALARDGLLANASHMVMLPDLLTAWLGGDWALERTNASTTQLYDPATGTWSQRVIAGMGLPPDLFTLPLVNPGQRLGSVTPAIQSMTGLAPDVRVVATATHDTAAAVAAVPAHGSNWAFISSGTWSLEGVERADPVKTPTAMAANLTNEVGVDGTIRLLRNVMGLWLVQESRRQWAREGRHWTHEELAALAEDAPAFGPLIDPDHADLLPPGDIPGRIRAACIASGQTPPESTGDILRCALESLALRYQQVLDLVERIDGRRVDAVHIVGGGSRNRLLCQLTADSCERPVIAGPAEATALGNVLVQLAADGEAASLADMREIARRSSTIEQYEPGPDRARWAERRDEFALRFPASG
jgi:rhamnulokinase